MALEPIQTPPSLDDFTLLSSHQEQTPGTFFGGKPVLHLHSPGATVKISKQDLEAQSSLAALLPSGATSPIDNTEDPVRISGVGVWVTSRQLTLWSEELSHGVQIPYTSIVVHAQEGNAVLLGLNLADANTPDEDMTFVQLHIIPTEIADLGPAGQEGEAEQTNGDSVKPDLALFNAISACQELNPDPPAEGEGEFDETAPGATGWITSENMADFMDENGEFKVPEGVTVYGEEEGGADGAGEGLGDGAGRARTAAEMDAEDGAQDDGKWQRTG